MKRAAFFGLAALLAALQAGCVGAVEWGGLSGDEHRAYTRSDSSCDDSARTRDPVCYDPTSQKQQH